MNHKNIICPKCNCYFAQSRIFLNPSCACLSIIDNNLAYYFLYYLNFKLISNNYNNATELVNFNNSNIKSISHFLPLIVENNILQIQKMIDKFNKLYTLS